MAETRNDSLSRDQCLECFLFVAVILYAVVFFGYAAVFHGIPPRRYDISIDSASGLDLPPPSTLDPQFNLTFRFASSNPVRPACIDAGTYLVVSYHCVPLAASAVTQLRFCVGAKKSVSAPLVAKGTGVRVPGHVMDSLAADLRNGVEAFEVTLINLSGDSFKDVASSCGLRRVGDVAVECGQGRTCPDSRERTTTSSHWSSIECSSSSSLTNVV